MNEPVALLNSVKDLVRFFLLFAVGMGWIAMNGEQQEQFMLMIGAAGLVIDQAVTWYTRSKVAPVRKFSPRVQKAIKRGEHDEVRAPKIPTPVRPPPPDLPDPTPPEPPMWSGA